MYPPTTVPTTTPATAQGGEWREEERLAPMLALTPESKTLHLKCLVQDIIQAPHRHCKVRETRPGYYITETPGLSEGHSRSYNEAPHTSRHTLVENSYK